VVVKGFHKRAKDEVILRRCPLSMLTVSGKRYKVGKMCSAAAAKHVLNKRNMFETENAHRLKFSRSVAKLIAHEVSVFWCKVQKVFCQCDS